MCLLNCLLHVSAGYCVCLQGDFRYQPVLMHDSATTVHRTHSNANTYLEVLDVTGHRGGEAKDLTQAMTVLTRVNVSLGTV